MGKIAMYEGVGDIFGRPARRGRGGESPTRRRHSKHNIKSPAVKRQNQKMKACALEYRKRRGSVKYQSFMKDCLKAK